MGLRASAAAGKACLARRVPERYEGHTWMAAMSRRWRGDSSKATNPTTTSTTARPTFGRSTTRRRRGESGGCNEPDDDFDPFDDRATHLGGMLIEDLCAGVRSWVDAGSRTWDLVHERSGWPWPFLELQRQRHAMACDVLHFAIPAVVLNPLRRWRTCHRRVPRPHLTRKLSNVGPFGVRKPCAPGEVAETQTSYRQDVERRRPVD
jgi:hypothetical protein